MKRPIVSAFRGVNLTILAFLSLTVLAQAQTEVREKALASSAASDAEIVRRQELVIRAQLLIREGETLLSRRDYSDAIVRFEEARSLLPSGPATSADANRVAVGLSTAYYRQGQDLYERGDLAAAHASLEKAVEADPKNEAAASLARKVAEKYEDQRRDKAATAAQTPAVVADPEFQKKRDRALELFYLGEDYFKSGQYDEAEKALREVLKIDPYSATAYHRLREVQKEKLAKYNAMKSQTEMQAAMQVAERWSTTSRINRSSFATTEQGETPINESGRAEILRKLQNIKIKRIEFENATIASAIKFLAEESRRADPGPEPKGVNIVLRLSGQASAGTTPTPGATGTAPAASPDEGGGKRINLILNDVELGRALTFLTQVADLKYIVNDGAVVVYDGIPTNNIQIKTFSVAPGVFRSVEGEKSGGAPPLGAGTGGTGGTSGGGFVPTASPASEKVEVKPIFETFGIQFPAGTSISYNESLGLLVVKHTPEVIDQIETLLLKLNKTPRQVTIETRFLDIRQDDLKELGFHWGFFYKTDSFIGGSGGFPITAPSAGLVFTEPSATRTAVTDLIGSAIDALIASGGTTPTPLMAIANLATNPAFTLTINALDRRGAINLLSAPRVTTLSGENAQILVTREFIYPSHFSDPQVVAGSGGSGAGSTAAAFVGPSPSEFTTREVGVVMNVRPTVGDDDYTVSMTLTPEVVDFEGFITYGGTAQVGGSTPVTFTIPQPLFSKRIVTTSVVVWDGQTVILGGLINEDERKFDDRVPILGDLPVVGRLFQSKGANSTKRNLMIFVTPSIVDPAGNPIHSTDSLIHLPTSATSAVLQQ